MSDEKPQNELSFAGCDKCTADGAVNALYLWDENVERHIACPAHGEISNQRKAEYEKVGTKFLIGKPVFEGSLFYGNEGIP